MKNNGNWITTCMFYDSFPYGKINFPNHFCSMKKCITMRKNHLRQIPNIFYAGNFFLLKKFSLLKNIFINQRRYIVKRSILNNMVFWCSIFPVLMHSRHFFCKGVTIGFGPKRSSSTKKHKNQCFLDKFVLAGRLFSLTYVWQIGSYIFSLNRIHIKNLLVTLNWRFYDSG